MATTASPCTSEQSRKGAASDEHILDQILASYQIPADTLQRVALAPSEIGTAIRQKRVAAMFALGPDGPGPLANVVTMISLSPR